MIERDGKTLYWVEITETRTQSFYVLGEDVESAYGDAEELAYELLDEDSYPHMSIDIAVATEEPDETELVWSGGPDGQDLVWTRSV